MAKLKYDYAGMLVRAAAVCIDAVILLPLTLLITKLVSENMTFEAIANLIASATYYVAFVSGPWQATPGKRLMGIHVINEDGSALTQQQALQRYLAYIMPSLPVYTSLDANITPMIMAWISVAWFMPVVLTEQRTAAHDLLCRTRVVHGKAGENLR